jgi:hypothetical protein
MLGQLGIAESKFAGGYWRFRSRVFGSGCIISAQAAPNVRQLRRCHGARGQAASIVLRDVELMLAALGISPSKFGSSYLVGNVIADVELMLAALGIDQRKFASIFLDSYSRERPCYRLPERECICSPFWNQKKICGQRRAKAARAF